MSSLVFCGWPYGNNYFHCGRIIGSFLPADIFTRWCKQNGQFVKFSSGVDCHGTPIYKKSINLNVDPKNIYLKYHQSFVSDFKSLGIDIDLFSLTASEVHKKFVRNTIEDLKRNNFIVEKEVSREYCKTCDMYLNNRFLIGVCKFCKIQVSDEQCTSCWRLKSFKTMNSVRCGGCNNQVSFRSYKTLIFPLEPLKEKILERGRRCLSPENYKSLKQNDYYGDIEVLRKIPWGIKIYDYNSVVYVWFQALLGYLSNEKKLNLGTSSKCYYHFFGIDNLYFHGVLFLGLLEALGHPNVTKMFVRKFLLHSTSKKLSSSKGNAIPIHDLLKIVPGDGIRWYLSRIDPLKKESVFSKLRIIELYNTELCNDIFNTFNRSFSIFKTVPNSIIDQKYGSIIKNSVLDVLIDEYNIVMGNSDLKKSTSVILKVAKITNKFIGDQELWRSPNVKSLRILLTYLKTLKFLLKPFVPFFSKELDRLNFKSLKSLIQGLKNNHYVFRFSRK